MVDVTQIFPVSEAGGEFLDRGPHNSDELSSSQFKRPDPKQNKDITLLEGAASWASAALSPFSLLLVGERLPMYKNSNASNALDGVEKFFRIPEKFYLKKGVETFHSGMKNLINIPIALANVGLTIFNGSSLPLFKDTSVSKAVSYIGDKLQKGWKVLEGVPYIGKLAKGVAWLNTKKNNIINSKATRNVLAVSLGLLLLGTGLIGIAVVTIAAAGDITKGALDVNKTKVLIDELNHLRSIKASQGKLTEDQKTALKDKYQEGKEVTTSRNELSLAIQNTGPAVMLQAPLAVATVLNPANALMLSELGGAALAAFGNKFTEESARAAIQAEIASLRENTGVSYDQTKSRKYDLANMAKDYAEKAGVNDQTYKVDSKL